MNAEKFSIHLVHLKAAYERLLAECALLTDKFNRLQKPDNEAGVAR
jgi:hypothetical protein